jgi:hypothetical protein
VVCAGAGAERFGGLGVSIQQHEYLVEVGGEVKFAAVGAVERADGGFVIGGAEGRGERADPDFGRRLGIGVAEGLAGVEGELDEELVGGWRRSMPVNSPWRMALRERV